MPRKPVPLLQAPPSLAPLVSKSVLDTCTRLPPSCGEWLRRSRTATSVSDAQG